ncbi:AzlD domain-containing protein [Caldimonas caldifontis]|uniref:Branched-chain amino acid transporter n=1 Tax=Caldimonas caldifontis TaxID=1452508 RepID=A0A2S5SSR6_9BURK|nr:AzlD domain-containing protein [Caldimonas caldifontis]PPE65734.1 branched-chain amino acid transporter [Caldimonas caldifontis]
MSTWEAILTIAGLAVITVLTRSFFLLPERELHMPGLVKRGLKYAPLAALAAVIAPEVLMTQGTLITTWQDARIFGLAAATAYYFWRRDILGTILTGMAIYLPLRLALGW